MDKGGVRKTVEFSRHLVKPLKSLAEQVGLGVDELVNVAVYELLVRTGHARPQSSSVPPPRGVDLVDRAEPAPPPRRPGGAAAGRQAPRSQAARERLLYFQIDGGEPIAVRKRVFLLGRGSKCDYILRDRGVSREHAVITRERGGWFIEDLNSANGVWINGEQIAKHRLSGDEEIQISNYTLQFMLK